MCKECRPSNKTGSKNPESDQVDCKKFGLDIYERVLGSNVLTPELALVSLKEVNLPGTIARVYCMLELLACEVCSRSSVALVTMNTLSDVLWGWDPKKSVIVDLLLNYPSLFWNAIEFDPSDQFGKINYMLRHWIIFICKACNNLSCTNLSCNFCKCPPNPRRGHIYDHDMYKNKNVSGLNRFPNLFSNVQ